MKVVFNEYGGCFEIFLEPENLEDAKKLIRIGLNSNRKPARIYSSCYEKSGINCSIVIGKIKNDISSIKPRTK